MPKSRLLARMPLWASQNPRDASITAAISSGKDQVLTRGFPTLIANEVAGTRSYYVEKFPGWDSLGVLDSGLVGAFAFGGENGTLVGYANASSGTNVYLGTTFVGATSTGAGGFATAYHVSECDLAGTYYYFITCINGLCFFLSETGIAGGVTFTADRTSGNATLANVSSFTGLVVGQALSGTGITAGTRILSLNPGGSSLVMTATATSGSATSTTVTRERMAKIIDADFPSDAVGPIVELKGRVFVGSSDSARVYQSAVNDPTSWIATEYVTANTRGDRLTALFKTKDYIGAMGVNSGELFYADPNNASGSVLSRADNLTFDIGCPGNPTLVRAPILSHMGYVVWVASVGGVYMLDGFRPVPINDELMGRGVTNPNIDCFYYQGRPYFLVTTTAYQRCFDVQKRMWFNSAFTDFLRITSNASSENIAVALGNTGGKRYQINTASFVDDGAAYSFQIRFGPTDFGSNGENVTITHYDLIADNQASGTALLEVNDKDYTSTDWVTKGSFDMMTTRKRINRGGNFRGARSHRLTHSANTAFRAQFLDVYGYIG